MEAVKGQYTLPDGSTIEVRKKVWRQRRDNTHYQMVVQ